MSTPNNLQIYDQFAESWWQDDSKAFRSLQNVNNERLKNIKRWLLPSLPCKIADLACGGGLLSVPLLKLGAEVSGIDLSQGSINSAIKAADGNGNFYCEDIRRTSLADKSFDAIILSDILEHLPDYYLAIKEAHRLLKNQGRLYVSTINRNFLSYIAAIKLAEGLEYIPKGTHDWKLFIKPQELVSTAKNIGFNCLHLQGEKLRVVKTLLNNKIFVSPAKSKLISYWGVFEKI